MRIAAISARDEGRRYTIKFHSERQALSAIYGPARSGKTAVADLIGHALFGKLPASTLGSAPPDGELLVEDRDGRYRVRRHLDASGHSRLAVAAIDSAPIDHQTILKLVGRLPAAVLTPLCAVSFRQPPDVARLLSYEFTTGFQRIAGEGNTLTTRRVSELAARRDLLAQELETRIATERRASKDLELRWRELDRLVREEQHQATAEEQRLKAVENSLAETDARLRYRRLELNVELRWHVHEAPSPDRHTELESQIARCRQTLSELNERESAARAQLAQTQTARPNSAAVFAEQQTWLAVSRQLAADLSGEVARLARASASQQCVCQDAHPRLRPIAETIERQLAVLEKSVEDQRQAINAADLAVEVDDLTRAQAELRRHLEHLLDRNQALLQGTAMARQDVIGYSNVFSAADAEQLENRRLELEQDRFHLVEQVNAAASKLKTLRNERDAVERERAALLSARSIEHVQRELAHVQKKLENAGIDGTLGEECVFDACLMRASDYLAKLTNGDIDRLIAFDQGRNVAAVNRHGATVSLELLTAAQRDQVYVSVCLAHLSVAGQHGIRLPLVLDDPFERLDTRDTAALAAVLEDFCRHGHQVLVFTCQREAAERLAAVGAEMHDMMSLRQAPSDVVPSMGSAICQVPSGRPLPTKKRNGDGRVTEVRRRKRKRAISPRDLDSTEPGHSDAA